jgi:hypothetical protein
MYRLVQAVTRATLADKPENVSTQPVFMAVQIISSRFLEGEFETWKACARYLPHAEAVLSGGIEGKSAVYSLEFTKLLIKVSWYLSKHNNPRPIEKAEESVRILQLSGRGMALNSYK